MKSDVIDLANELCAAARALCERVRLAKSDAWIEGYAAATNDDSADGAPNPYFRTGDPLTEPEPLTSPQRDNREAPACACGAPVYADGLCVRCCEDRHEASNRALPPSEQRD